MSFRYEKSPSTWLGSGRFQWSDCWVGLAQNDVLRCKDLAGGPKAPSRVAPSGALRSGLHCTPVGRQTTVALAAALRRRIFGTAKTSKKCGGPGASFRLAASVEPESRLGPHPPFTTAPQAVAPAPGCTWQFWMRARRHAPNDATDRPRSMWRASPSRGMREAQASTAVFHQRN